MVAMGWSALPPATQMPRRLHRGRPRGDPRDDELARRAPRPWNRGSGAALIVTQHALRGPAPSSMARWYWGCHHHPNASGWLSWVANAAASVPLCSDPQPCSMCTATTTSARPTARRCGTLQVHPTDIVYRSVKTYLDVVEGDPEDPVHGLDAGRYNARLEPMRVLFNDRRRADGRDDLRRRRARPFGTHPAPLESLNCWPTPSRDRGGSPSFTRGPCHCAGLRRRPSAGRIHRSATTASGWFTVTLQVSVLRRRSRPSPTRPGVMKRRPAAGKAQRSVGRYAPLSRGVTVGAGTLRGGHGSVVLVNVRTTIVGGAASGSSPCCGPRVVAVGDLRRSLRSPTRPASACSTASWVALRPGTPAPSRRDLVVLLIGTAIRTRSACPAGAVPGGIGSSLEQPPRRGDLRPRGGHSYGIRRGDLVPARVRIWPKPAPWPGAPAPGGHHGAGRRLPHDPLRQLRGVARFEVMGRSCTYCHLARAAGCLLLLATDNPRTRRVELL